MRGIVHSGKSDRLRYISYRKEILVDITEEDFPVYQQLVKLNNPGIALAINDFVKATTGGDEEKYKFALGIQTVAVMPVGKVPGVTKDMQVKTLQSCLKVFEDVASRGHKGAQQMVVYFKLNRLGGPEMPSRNIDSIWKKKPPQF